MIKAVERQTSVFACAGGDLQHDFEVVVTAFGGSENRLSVRALATDFLSSDRWEEESPFLRRILNDAEAKVIAHEGFTKAFVHGITSFAGPDCRLSMLANDAETSLALKQMIAAFLGAPVGKELRILCRKTRLDVQTNNSTNCIRCKAVESLQLF